MQEWPPSLHSLAPHCPRHPPHIFLQWDPSPFPKWLLLLQTSSRPIRDCASHLLSLRPRQWMVPSVPHPASAGKTLFYRASSQAWAYMDFWLISLILHSDPDCEGHRCETNGAYDQPYDGEESQDEDSCSEHSSSTSTSTNQKEGKYCDCCYCEFFGHGGVRQHSLLPISMLTSTSHVLWHMYLSISSNFNYIFNIYNNNSGLFVAPSCSY